jgi:hypothetical protein
MAVGSRLVIRGRDSKPNGADWIGDVVEYCALSDSYRDPSEFSEHLCPRYIHREPAFEVVLAIVRMQAIRSSAAWGLWQMKAFSTEVSSGPRVT